jgi:hypothetical protein
LFFASGKNSIAAGEVGVRVKASGTAARIRREIVVSVLSMRVLYCGR